MAESGAQWTRGRSKRAQRAVERWARDAQYRTLQADQDDDDSLGSEELRKTTPEVGEPGIVPGVPWMRKVSARDWRKDFRPGDGKQRKAIKYRDVSRTGIRVKDGRTFKLGEALLADLKLGADGRALEYQAYMDSEAVGKLGPSLVVYSDAHGLHPTSKWCDHCACQAEHAVHGSLDSPSPEALWTFVHEGRTVRVVFDRQSGELLRAV
jgi:hypothetical protein